MSEEDNSGFECSKCGTEQVWCDFNICAECGDSCCDNCAATYGIKPNPLLCHGCMEDYDRKGLPHD